MKPLVDTAVKFVSALVEGDFDRAHELLTPKLKQTMTPESLKHEFYGMFRSYAEGAATDIWYDSDSVMTDWPGNCRGIWDPCMPESKARTSTKP